MLKHSVQYHPELHPSEVDFRIKILSYHRSAFERQVTEAVLIRRNMGPKQFKFTKDFVKNPSQNVKNSVIFHFWGEKV